MGKENNSMFIKKCKKEAKRGAKYAFKVDVSYKEKIKAMIIRINPLFSSPNAISYFTFTPTN